MRKSETQKRLEAAGFRIDEVYPGAKWFKVVSPDNHPGYVLCQSFAAWHFFYADFIGTASSCIVDRCHRDGLGDAIGTDSQMSTYKRLLHWNNIPTALRNVGSIREAVSQVERD